jgi:hypothetical protein
MFIQSQILGNTSILDLLLLMFLFTYKCTVPVTILTTLPVSTAVHTKDTKVFATNSIDMTGIIEAIALLCRFCTSRN